MAGTWLNSDAKNGAGRLVKRRRKKIIAAILVPVLLCTFIFISAAVSMTTVITAVMGMAAQNVTEKSTCTKTSDTDDSDGSDIIDKYIEAAKSIAADDSHGYDQTKRDLNPDTDCSGFVYFALKQAGIKNLPSTPFDTGTMDDPLSKGGFKKHEWDKKESSLQKGDILWWNGSGGNGHTEIYIGGGKTVGAHQNENGGVTGGKPGDQNGKEIAVVPFDAGKYTHYFRLEDTSMYGSSKSSAGKADSSLTAAMGGNENAAYVAEALIKGEHVNLNGLKFNRVMAAAILGVWENESNVTFKRVEQRDGLPSGIEDYDNAKMRDVLTKRESERGGSPKGGGYVGLGLAQWTWMTSRAGTLLNLADSMHKKWSDREVQLQMFVNEMSGGYRKAYNAIAKATNTNDAVKQFVALYEGVSSQDCTKRQQDAAKMVGILTSQNYGTTDVIDPNNIMTKSTNGAGSSPDTDDDDDTQCAASDNGGSDGDGDGDSAKYGEIGGAPTNTDNYGWMCNSNLKVCKDGDYGPFPWNTNLGYQCYWYWIARSYMVFNGDMVNPKTENAGQLYDQLQGKPGWTTSKSPKPGAGASFWNPGGGGNNNHVVFVEKVEDDPSGWKITISEGNVKNPNGAFWNEYNVRTYTKTEFEQAHGTGFFWRTSWNL